MSIVSIVLWSFHGRNLTAWQQLWVTGPDTTLNVSIVKRDLPDSPPGSPCFCPFCLRKLPSDICLESYRTYLQSVGSTLLLSGMKKLSEKFTIVKRYLQVPVSVRSFLSPTGTVQCSLYAHYKSVSKQQEGYDLHLKSKKLCQFTFLSLISLHLWFYLKCRKSLLL